MFAIASRIANDDRSFWFCSDAFFAGNQFRDHASTWSSAIAAAAWLGRMRASWFSAVPAQRECLANAEIIPIPR